MFSDFGRKSINLGKKAKQAKDVGTFQIMSSVTLFCVNITVI